VLFPSGDMVSPRGGSSGRRCRRRTARRLYDMIHLGVSATSTVRSLHL